MDLSTAQPGAVRRLQTAGDEALFSEEDAAAALRSPQSWRAAL